MREEIARIRACIKEEFGLEDVCWSAEWNRTQCLGSFRSVGKQGLVADVSEGEDGLVVQFSADMNFKCFDYFKPGNVIEGNSDSGFEALARKALNRPH